MTLTTSPSGVKLIQDFEGFRGTAYLCPAKVWTIGWGHTSAAGDPAVVKGMMINRTQGEQILRADLKKFEAKVRSLIAKAKVDIVLQHEFDAFVSFSFNVGLGAFAGSTALKRYLRGDKAGAADALLAWNRATVNGVKVVLAGLTRRRQAERALFLGDRVVAQAIAPTCGPMAQAVCAPTKREPMSKSSTGNTAVATGGAGVMVAFKGARQAVGILGDVKNSASDAAGLIPGVPDNAAILVGLGVLIAIGAGVIWFRRWRRSREDEIVENDRVEVAA